MSIEAMAMAGMDYKECAISLEEWDQRGPEQAPPPPYLQAEHNVFVDVDVEWMKTKLREWAKAVASKKEQALFLISNNEKCTVSMYS